MMGAYENALRSLAFRAHWVEIARNILEFHETQQEKFGKVTRGRSSSNGDKDGWGIRQTAEDLNISIAMVSDYLNLGRALREDPSLKIKELRDAIHSIRKKIER
jgi:hypothetical protein